MAQTINLPYRPKHLALYRSRSPQLTGTDQARVRSLVSAMSPVAWRDRTNAEKQ
jgi:hypothetical protein